MTRRDGRFDWALALCVALAVVSTIASRAYVNEGGGRRIRWDRVPNHGREVEGAHALYFFSPGCGSCTEANRAFEELRESRSDLRIVAFDLSSPVGWADARRTQTALADGLRVPEMAMNEIPPGLFLPSGYTVGDERVSDAFRRLGNAEPGALPRFAPLEGRSVAPVPSLGLAATALAGLADGVNPCALTGLAFLLAYLLHGGRSRRSLVGGVGALFCAGTFCAYFVAGLGLYFAIARFDGLPAGRLLLTAASAVASGAFCLCAWWQLRHRGGAVSATARRAEHRLVRWATHPALLWLGAPVLGASFALLELACTGQVYLPALALLASSGEPTHALAGLLTYNAAFVAPPLALTAAVVLGGRAVSHRAFAPWAARGRRAIAWALTILSAFLLSEVHRAAAAL